ncbi:hypothetical protein BYT27DRAFT_7344198 [Phlegmacium glaucopus]|nr:hypothetical protein BYT27DRAFT_7344198 [Phlegmacium glaucopus]
MALPEPASAPKAPEPNSGTIEADNVDYRICPRIHTDCPVVGQYDKGTHIDIICHTVDDTTPINGDPAWAKLTNGFWVSLQYVSWTGTIPFCRTLSKM